jgi:hypothetical protein
MPLRRANGSPPGDQTRATGWATTVRVHRVFTSVDPECFFGGLPVSQMTMRQVVVPLATTSFSSTPA